MNYKHFLAGLFVLTSMTVQGQKGMEGVPKNIMTPDVATLGKYGTYDVSYYTGSPNISIPLHQLTDNGMNIPISIYYDASGFIPNKNAGVVGLNWNLTAGGAITRIVNSTKDELNNSNNPNTAHDNIGYIYGQQLGTTPSYTSEYIRKLDFFNPSFPLDFNLAYEYTPDIFSFNFLGNSGRFFMDQNGVVQVTGNKNYKVDLTNLKIDYDMKPLFLSFTSTTLVKNTLISEIIMTSDDGYVFYFGGALKNLEIGFDASSTVGTPTQTSGTVNSWFLTKVISPEGQETLFKYREYTEDERTKLVNLFDGESNGWENIDGPFVAKTIYRNERIKGFFTDNEVPGPEETGKIHVAFNLVSYLTEISTATQTVTFQYTEKDKTNNFYGQPSRGFDFNGVSTVLSVFKGKHYTQKLSSIQIFDKYAPKNSDEFTLAELISFNYQNQSTTASGVVIANRQFLSGITTKGGNYSFDYNNINTPNALPDPLTRGIDMWGYYNGQNSNPKLIPMPDLSSSEYEANLSGTNVRTPDATYSQYGMLNKITYPTGGKTEFAYEGHNCSIALKRKLSMGFTPDFTAVSNQAVGGLRIRQIKSTPGITTDFKYVTGYELNPASTVSSGISSNNGVYYVVDQEAAQNYRAYNVSDNNIAAGSTYGESHIGYKEVVAITGDGYTKYSFTNHQTNPDVYYLGNDAYKITPETSINSFNDQMKRLSYYSSKDMERGKLKVTSVFDNNNVERKRIVNSYNEDPLRSNTRSIAVKQTYTSGPRTKTLVQSYALYYYQNNITKTVETDFPEQGSAFEKTTTYHYKSNTSNLVDETTVTQSNLYKIKTVYKYPVDFAPASPYNVMLTKFMLSPVVEELKYRVPPTSPTDPDVLLEAAKTNYGIFTTGNIIKPSSRDVKKGPLNSYEPAMVYNKYDLLGNLLSYTKKNDNRNSFIYDYSNSFIIAKVENAAEGHYCYTSFEAEGTGEGKWTFSGTPQLYQHPPTGSKAYQLNGSNNLTKTGLSSGTKYILSYWTTSATALSIPGTIISYQSQQGNGWKCFVHEITGQTTVTVSGSVWIDEVRLFPDKAMMATYTYKGSGDPVSMNDASNRIMYYTYDAFGRLTLIRDKDRNIIKKYCYNFSGQVEDCNSPCFTMEPVWQNTSTPPTCITNSCGNTGYQWQEQQNINTCNLATTQNVQVHNPVACPPSSGYIPLTYNNPSNIADMKVSYTPFGGGTTITFVIPPGSGNLGCVPSGVKYNMRIYYDGTGLMPFIDMWCGVTMISGTEGNFSGVNLGFPDNRNIIIDWGL